MPRIVLRPNWSLAWSKWLLTIRHWANNELLMSYARKGCLFLQAEFVLFGRGMIWKLFGNASKHWKPKLLRKGSC